MATDGYSSSTSSLQKRLSTKLVTYYKGAELEEDHYYPFGLNLEATSLPAAVNNIKYNSKELQRNEFTGTGLQNLELEDFANRVHDPQTGRWWQPDPMADYFVKQSPYCTMDDNPAVNNDPTGTYSEFGAWWRNLLWGGSGTSYTKTGGWGVNLAPADG